MLRWGKLGCKPRDYRQGSHSEMEMELEWEMESGWELA
jgi:hypothetical protein